MRVNKDFGKMLYPSRNTDESIAARSIVTSKSVSRCHWVDMNAERLVCNRDGLKMSMAVDFPERPYFIVTLSNHCINKALYMPEFCAKS